MDRRGAFLLAALSPVGLAFSAFAQQGYPYMLPYPGYAPMPMQAGYGNGMYGQPTIPVMAVPVPYPVIVTRPVPMFGALETMPANGPLGGPSVEQATVQKPVEHVTAMKPKSPESLAEPAKTPAMGPVRQPQPAATAPQAARPASPVIQPVAAPVLQELGALASQSDAVPSVTTQTVPQTKPVPAPVAPAKTGSQAEMLKYYVHEDTN